MKKPHKYNIFHTLFSHSSNKLILLYYLLCFLSPLSVSSANNDLQQLLSFKSLLLDSSQLPNWSNTNKLCDFVGVTCNINSNVVSIDLSIKKLLLDFKAVSSFLLTLPSLETLVLKNTNITAKLKLSPRSQCSSVLTNLDLAENSISGPISDISSLSSCIKLKSLNLSGNLMEYPASDSKGLSFSLESLDISYNKIVGPNFVPWLLSEGCSELRHLSLKGNKIAGPVLQVQDCKQLEFLDLSSNNFSTGVPKFNDFLVLDHLDLSSNKFYGDISASISSCKKLTFLNISQNDLGGGLIPFMSSGNLKYLYLSANGFQGLMPPHLSDLCSSLVELDVSGNSLTGVVPESFGACSSLELLDISNNNFSGKLPIDTLLKLSSLKHLMFGFNNFVGELPVSFSKMTKLETLDVSSNLLHGSVPVGICQDPRNSLKVLYLQNNEFTGRIPDSLSNCSHLESLDISFNYLDGRIPSSLGSLSNLRDLILWLNQLHGRIPEELMYIKTLENLILDFNDLTGSIPASLSNCTRLNWISLSNNQLSGEIPASFGQLTNLTILKLGNNSLTGSIPSELGDCRSLIWMDLNTNFLSGTIPPALFKQSGNIAAGLRTGKPYGYIKNDGSKECHGAGNLLEFGGIRQEQKTRISTRHPCNFTRVYWGITRPTFHNNGSIIFLDLSYNKLVGCLPKELGSMYYIQILNLGHNDLSCAIPEELGKMRSMAILDLSYNRLNGSIPPTMTGLNFLVDIDLSNNYISGMIPESAPFDTFPEYRFLNNSGLCGYPLPRCVSGKTNLSGHNKKSSHRQASLAASVAMGLLFSLFCIFGVVFIAVEAKKRRKKKEDTLEAYMESHSHSGTANSGWKLTSAREALSISLATFDKPLRKLTFADLLEATNGFHDNTLVGSGGFGHVYRAQLKDGSIVAVKKLAHVSGQGDREFTAEMETIGKIKHRNLVPLLGYCKVGDERLLVYEYMKFGSLEDVLHDRKKTGIILNWAARRKIAIGAAKGLAFLHSCDPHIIHRDMKSSNVLLDEGLEARVSDFGMAREMNAMDTHLSVSTLAGTPGYVPPEYYQSFKCTTKGDVYSYGIVLLELLTGRQPTDCLDFGDNNLLGWVRQHTRLKISNVFDPHLLKEDPSLELELLQHLKIACACSDDRPWRRPTMIQVMAMFKDIQAGSGPDDVSFGAVEGVEMIIIEDVEIGNQADKTLLIEEMKQ